MPTKRERSRRREKFIFDVYRFIIVSVERFQVPYGTNFMDKNLPFGCMGTRPWFLIDIVGGAKIVSSNDCKRSK